VIAYTHGVWRADDGLGGICWLASMIVRPLQFRCVVLEVGAVKVHDPRSSLLSIEGPTYFTGSFVVVRNHHIDFTDLLLRAYRGLGYIYKSGYVPLHSMCFYFPLSNYFYRESKYGNWNYCISALDLIARDLANGIRKSLSASN